MRREEELARAHAPVLSIARYIFETRRLPKVGETWKVDAEVVDLCALKAGTLACREFSFDVEVNSDLLFAANAMARSMLGRNKPLWLKNAGSHAVGIRPERLIFRTCVDDLRQLIQRQNHMFEEGQSKPGERWVLAYLSLYWAPLVPAQGAKDYYLGEVHGLRIAIDFFETTYPGLQDGDCRILLGVVLVALAAVSAERHFGQTPRLGNDRHLGKASSIPRDFCKHRPAAFAISDEEASSLARIEAADADDKDRCSVSTRAEFETTASLLIEPGSSREFYDGLMHGLYLSLQVVLVFHDTILGHPDSMLNTWEETLLRICGVAAKYKLGCA